MSEAVKSILDYFKEIYGDIEFTAEEAGTVFGGSKGGKVKDLTDAQTIQYCLLDAYGKLSKAGQAIEDAHKYITELEATAQNRATRRSKK
jgi:hypothetical protein